MLQPLHPPLLEPQGSGGEDMLVSAKRYRFLRKVRQENPQIWENPRLWEQHSIYKVPSRTRELNPKAYEPRVVSIGPYHNGKDHLEAMELHKLRALNHFLKRIGSKSPEGLVSEFRKDAPFLRRLRASYGGALGMEWDDNMFAHLMVLDGCFLFEVLLTAAGEACDAPRMTEWCYEADDPVFGTKAERHSVLSYIKADLLMVENQLPLAVVQKFAAKLAYTVNGVTYSESGINWLVREFYGCNHDGLPTNPDEPLGLHVLDVYRRSRLLPSKYAGWTSTLGANDLHSHGVHLGQSTGIGSSSAATASFKDVSFVRMKKRDFLGSVYDHFMDPLVRRRPKLTFPGFLLRTVRFFAVPGLLCRLPFAQWTAEWYIFSVLFWVAYCAATCVSFVVFWWYIPLWVVGGNLTLPVIVIDGMTEAVLLNLMAFERLHLGRPTGGKVDMAVTCYVFFMSSLVRSEEDVAFLREEGILSCVPERRDKDVVKLFRGMTRDVVVDGSRGLGEASKEMEELCGRKPNKLQAWWTKNYGKDIRSRVTTMIAVYALLFSVVTTVMGVLNYALLAGRRMSCTINATNN